MQPSENAILADEITSFCELRKDKFVYTPKSNTLLTPR
jgi:hypothetical protein